MSKVDCLAGIYDEILNMAESLQKQGVKDVACSLLIVALGIHGVIEQLRQHENSKGGDV